jgi:tRNA(fMet)-specific endonuclease VapC
MKYLLDSNAISVWAKRGSPAFLTRLLQVSPANLCISSVVEMELLFGIELKPQFSYVRELQTLLKQLPVVAFESADAMQAAKLRAALQRTGKPIGPYDGLIAATALARDMILVTNNTREFSRVIDLMVEDWQS